MSSVNPGFWQMLAKESQPRPLVNPTSAIALILAMPKMQEQIRAMHAKNLHDEAVNKIIGHLANSSQYAGNTSQGTPQGAPSSGIYFGNNPAQFTQSSLETPSEQPTGYDALDPQTKALLDVGSYLDPRIAAVRNSKMNESYRNKMLALQEEKVHKGGKPKSDYGPLLDPVTMQPVTKPEPGVEYVRKDATTGSLMKETPIKQQRSLFGGQQQTLSQDDMETMQKLEAAGFNPHLTSFSAAVMVPIYSGAIKNLMKSDKLTKDEAVQKMLSNQRRVQGLMNGAKGLGSVVPKIQASMEGVENTIDLLQGSMKKIQKKLTGSPLLNSPLLEIQDKMAGDPDVRAYMARRETMKQELTKALISNGISGTAASDAARKEVDDIFPLNQTPAQFDASVKISKQDMAARMAGYSKTFMEYTGGALPGTTTVPPAPDGKNKTMKRGKYNPQTGQVEW